MAYRKVWARNHPLNLNTFQLGRPNLTASVERPANTIVETAGGLLSRPARSPSKSEPMNELVPRPNPAAERMRRHRQRRRDGLRCLMIELRETEIDVLVAKGTN